MESAGSDQASRTSGRILGTFNSCLPILAVRANDFHNVHIPHLRFLSNSEQITSYNVINASFCNNKERNDAYLLFLARLKTGCKEGLVCFLQVLSHQCCLFSWHCPSCRRCQASEAAVREAATDPATLNSLDSNNGLLQAAEPAQQEAFEPPHINADRTGRLVFAPEDFKLEPGAYSQIDRLSPASPEDVFRCNSCTEAACQVCARLYSYHMLTSHVEHLAMPLQKAKLEAAGSQNFVVVFHACLSSLSRFERGASKKKTKTESKAFAGSQRVCEDAMEILISRIPSENLECQSI